MLARAPKSELEKQDMTLSEANAGALSRLADMLKTLNDEDYTKTSAGFSAIGGHVRHIIEFYQEYIKAEKSNFENSLGYDNRERNMLYETSRESAIAEITDLIERTETLEESNRPVPLIMTIDPDNKKMQNMVTTPSRELFHLLDHTTHHMALIKMTAAQYGAECDQNFGMANSTLVYNKTSSQA